MMISQRETRHYGFVNGIPYFATSSPAAREKVACSSVKLGFAELLTYENQYITWLRSCWDQPPVRCVALPGTVICLVMTCTYPIGIYPSVCHPIKHSLFPSFTARSLGSKRASRAGNQLILILSYFSDTGYEF